MISTNKRWKPYLATILFIAGMAATADGIAIYLKAHAAQILIEQAWKESINSGQIVKPWPWADTWPVARLRAKEAGTDLYVLQGAQGSALAFGPGWMADGVEPEQRGTKLIAGHRDTHFKFLQKIKKNDVLSLINKHGTEQQYRVHSIQIIDTSKENIMIDSREEKLVLITCYPFDAIETGGPQRYIVSAVRD